jgi:hypothetical protein
MTAEDRFARPAPAWFVALDGGNALTGVLAVSRTAHDAVSLRVRVPSRGALKALLVGTAVVHVAEAVYAYRVANENGFHRSASRWAVQTFVVGFPSLLKLREEAIDAGAEAVEAA